MCSATGVPVEIPTGHLYPGEMDRYTDRLDEAAGDVAAGDVAAGDADAAKMRPDDDASGKSA